MGLLSLAEEQELEELESRSAEQSTEALLTPEENTELQDLESRGGFIQARAESLQEQQSLRTLEKQQAEAERRASLGEQFFEPTAINDFELNDPGLRFRLAQEETLAGSLDILSKSGKLPENATAIGLRDPDTGGEILGFTIPGKEGSPQQFFTIDSPNTINVSDLADIGGVLANFEVLLSVGGAFLPQMKVAGVAGRAAIDFISALTGRSIDELIDQMRGGEKFSAADVAIAGGFNVAAGRVGDLFIGSFNLARGAGARGTGREGAEDVIDAGKASAVQAAEDLGLAPAAVGGPIATRAEQISAGAGRGIPGIKATGIGDLPERRRIGVADILRREAGDVQTQLAEIGDVELLKLVDDAKNIARGTAEIDISLSKDIIGRGVREVSKEQGGRAAGNLLEESGFAGRTRIEADKAFDDYFNLAGTRGVKHDLGSLIDEANSLSTKFDLAAGSETVETGLLDAAGKPFTKEVPVTEEFGPTLDAQLSRLITQIKKLDEIQAGNPAEASRALSQIRSNLIDLAEKDPLAGTRTQSQGIAARLLRTLHESITTPINAPAGVGEAFEKANNLWRARSKVLDAFSIADHEIIGSGEQLFNKLVGNLTEEHAKVLKKELSPQKFEEFQLAMLDDLLRTPKAIEGKLTQLGRGGEILIPAEMRDVLRIYQRDIRNIDVGVLNALFEKQGVAAAEVGKIIESGTAKELKTLIGKGALKGEQLDQLIFQDFLLNTTEIVDANAQVIPKAFTKQVEKLKNGKFWEMLNDNHRQILQKLEDYTSFLKGADAGSSIAAAEIAAAQLTPGTNPARAIQAKLKAAQIGLIANAANSKTMTNLFVGRRATAKPFTNFRASVIFTLQALNKLTTGKTTEP